MTPCSAVVEGKVPNAAAMIMLDQNKALRRVIAYNPVFMGDVIKATRANNWAPVSIMAHEIGHHLSGHTIVPGGRQPPIELESDKFSGFVLYKMGAPLNDAQKAIATLIPEQDGETHPGCKKRLAAIQDGWTQACQQQGGSNCNSGLAMAAAPAAVPAAKVTGQAPASTPAAKTASPAPASAPAAKVPAATGAAVAKADTLPKADAKALPSKGMQFIYDEFGYLDPYTRAEMEKQMYDHAQKVGVEIVTMLVKDLKGLSAEDYAKAMMRQLRIGKLDVGNGALLVVAPEQKQAAALLGPGVALEMELYDMKTQLLRWVDMAWSQCSKKGNCGIHTENLLDAADQMRRDTSRWSWDIAYTSLGDMQKMSADELQKKVAPKDSKVLRKIVRFTGTVTNLKPDPNAKHPFVNSSRTSRGWIPIHVGSDDGLTVMFYMDPKTEALMPGGKLQPGKKYVFVARAAGLSWNPKDTQALNLLSYTIVE